MSKSRNEPLRPSGAAWLGDVPVEWGVLSGRRVFEARREAALDGDEQLSATQRYGVVPQREFMEREDQKVMLALSGVGNFKHVERHDFVISLRSFEGGIEHSAFTGCVSPAYTVLRLRKEGEPSYFRYLLKSGPYVAALQSTTDSLRDGKSINYEQFGAIPLPLPPVPEQTAIATFLDRETGKIDALVGEQRRLIELLKEKRQAVISHAVTKGLDPNAKMKPSGVEWLGDIPEDWSAVPLKSLANLAGRIGYRGYTTQDIVPEGEGAITLSPSNLRDGYVTLDRCTYISWDKYEESPEIKVSPREIVMVKTGSSFGKVAFVRADTLPPTTINPQLVIIRAFGCQPEFLFFALSASHTVAEIEVSNTGGTIPTMTQEAIGNFVIALPPQGEQDKVLEFLAETTGTLDMLVAEADRTVGLLQERRAALISAAVTGKIDVRDSQGGEAV